MSTDEQSAEPTRSAPGDLVLELNFVPTWARQPPAANPYAAFEGERRREPRDRDRPPRGGPGAGPGRGPGRGPRQGPGRGPRPRDRDERDRRGFVSRRPPREGPAEPAPAPVAVSFIPERRHLGVLAHELRASGRAYPLADLASRFLQTPACHEVKIETRSGSGGQPAPQLYQCRACQLLFQNLPEFTGHALAMHLDTVFTREQQQTEPPVGAFACVARCRLSGELLGPPNYHAYNARLQELWRTRFAHMTLDEYRSHIETVREPEQIEKWKQSVSVRTVYRFKDQPELPPLSEAEVQKIFSEQHLPKLSATGRRFIVPAALAQQLTDPGLRRAVRESWFRESRHPYSVMLALRPALHHMHLYLFKTAGGQTFATAIQPHPLEPRRAVKAIAEALHYLRRHPGCTRHELVEKLRPGMAADSPQAAMVLSPLRWLIEKGHVIEFFDGTLSVPGGVPAAPEPHDHAPGGGGPAAHP